MPQVFKIGSYWVFFWTSEGRPLEPVHVHIAQGAPKANATKVWITSRGKCLLANNNSNIDPRILRNMIRIVEARSDEVVRQWQDCFGETSFYC